MEFQKVENTVVVPFVIRPKNAFFFLCLLPLFSLIKTLFKSVLTAMENGGKPVGISAPTTVGYTKEQAEAIQRLKTAKDNYARLGLTAGASR